MSTGLLNRTPAETRVQAHALTPVLGEQWQLSWMTVAIVGWFSFLFLLINHTPLSLSHTWRHANVGHWIMVHGEMPTTLPHVPLAEGMPYIAESWLFDSGLYVLAKRFGPEAISTFNALATSGAMWIWCALYYRVSRSTYYSLLAAIALAASWSMGFGYLHPRMMGATILATILWLILPARPWGAIDDGDRARADFVLPRWRWWTTILLFALWANIDSSFVFGLLVLAAIACGQCMGRLRRAGWRGFSSSGGQRWSLLLQTAALATCLNPHYHRIWGYAITTNLDRLLRGVTEGQGLYLPTVIGAGVAILLAFTVWRFLRSNVSVEPSELAVLLLLLVTAALSASHSFWFAPLTLLIAARHWPASPNSSKSTTNSEHGQAARPLRFVGTLVCVLLVWCGFALSPSSVPLLGGRTRSHARLFEAKVPHDLTNFLSEHAKTETNIASADPAFVYAPKDWADWILWDGPSELRVFASSQFDVLPRRVKADYAKVFRGEAGWERVLDRYRVGTLVIDKQRQPLLASAVMRTANWYLVSETPKSLTLRRTPLRGGPPS